MTKRDFVMQYIASKPVPHPDALPAILERAEMYWEILDSRYPKAPVGRPRKHKGVKK